MVINMVVKQQQNMWEISKIIILGPKNILKVTKFNKTYVNTQGDTSNTVKKVSLNFDLL